VYSSEYVSLKETSRNVDQRVQDMSTAVGGRIPHSATLHDTGLYFTGTRAFVFELN